MVLPLIFISLRDDVDRRRHLAGQLSPHSLTAQWLSAEERGVGTHKEDVPGRLSGAQMACWLSHRKAWQWLADLDVPVAGVLEDDVHWLQDPRSFLSEMAMDDLDILNLGSITHRSEVHTVAMDLLHPLALLFRGFRQVSTYSAKLDQDLRRAYVASEYRATQRYLRRGGQSHIVRGPFGGGCHAYLIRRTTAIQLLSRPTPTDVPIDDYLSDLSSKGKIRGGRVAPAVATQFPFPSRLR